MSQFEKPVKSASAESELSSAVAVESDAHEHHQPSGIGRWIYSTNHKDIGTLYLWFSFIMFLTGGAMAMVIRAELFQPGLQLVDPQFFNQMTTVHGLVMVFGAVMPAFTGLANWMIPMMIGAPDMALPRMNNLSFWILPFAFLILIGSLFLPGGGPDFGLDFLCAAFDQVWPRQHGTVCVLCAHHGDQLHHGRDHCDSDHRQYACSGYDLV